MTVCGRPGSNGCAGGGGGAGGPGSGGGSAIGVFLWDAKLRIESGMVSVGRGGNGGVAAVGGLGAQGSPGQAATLPALCPTCVLVENRPGGCSELNSSPPNGEAGGSGGDGKPGGSGGGGSGGHSYAIYKGGTATATVAPDVELSSGLPGTGAGTGSLKGADGISMPIGL